MDDVWLGREDGARAAPAVGRGLARSIERTSRRQVADRPDRQGAHRVSRARHAILKLTERWPCPTRLVDVVSGRDDEQHVVLIAQAVQRLSEFAEGLVCTSHRCSERQVPDLDVLSTFERFFQPEGQIADTSRGRFQGTDVVDQRSHPRQVLVPVIEGMGGRHQRRDVRAVLMVSLRRQHVDIRAGDPWLQVRCGRRHPGVEHGDGRQSFHR